MHLKRSRTNPLRAVASLTVLACLVAACGRGGTDPSSARPLARGMEASRSAIPWDDLGPGWSVATWGPARPEPVGTTVPAGRPTLSTESVTLYLVDPEGGRYRIASFPPSPYGSDVLESWSGDRKRVLLVRPNGTPNVAVRVVSLASGRSHTFSIDNSTGAVFSNPDGHDVLAVAGTEDPLTLEQANLDGKVGLTYPQTFSGVGRFDGSFASSPNGQIIAMGEAEGRVALVSDGGGRIRDVVVPGTTECTPSRWWSATEVLVTCQPAGNTHALLWLVSTSGTKPSPFTLAGSPGADQGDEAAWQVGRSVYVQSEGGCGYGYVAKRNTHHTTSPVYVPLEDTHDSVFVLGATGDQMLVQATLACGPGRALLWLDPAKGAVRVVLGPGMNGGSVTSALLFGVNNGAQ
jgi:hypothetical protein